MGRRRCWMTCLDCGERELMLKHHLDRRTLPRCGACGGPLEASAKERDERASLLDKSTAIRVDTVDGRSSKIMKLGRGK